LASNLIYISYAHSKKVVDMYLEEAFQVYSKIALGNKNNELSRMLEGPICHSGFSRLT